MSKFKISFLITGALIVGIIIGISFGSSSTTGKSSSNSKEGAQQSTVKSGDSSTSQSSQSAQKSTGKVEVKSQTKRVGITGHTEIVGEVVNNTQNEARSVKVYATFYDANGKVIATNFTYAGDSDTPLAVGATSPFEVSSYPNKINADSFKLDVTWR